MIDTTDPTSWVYDGGDEWTDEDSAALDAEILRDRARHATFTTLAETATKSERMPMPERCRGCDRPLRKKTAPLDPSGRTRTHASRGLCSTCYRHEVLGGKAMSRPGPCRSCAVPLRTKTMKADGVSRIHYGRGLCPSCHRKGVE